MLARPNDYCNFHGGWGLSLQTRVAPVGSIPATADSLFSCNTTITTIVYYNEQTQSGNSTESNLPAEEMQMH